MMMQALDAGGVQPLTDGERTADDDNPRGYYELECVKQIRQDDSFLDGAQGKAVKLIHMLVTRLPARHTFRVLVMRRHIDEIFASQAKMLARSGKAGGIDARTFIARAALSKSPIQARVIRIRLFGQGL